MQTSVDVGNVCLNGILFFLRIHAGMHFARFLVTMDAQRLVQCRLLLHKLFMLLHQCRQLILAPLRIESAELQCLFRLHGKRLKLCRMGIHNIVQTHEIALVLAQLAQRLLLARTILRNTRCFLKEHAAILWATVKDVVQSVLTDDAHAVMADARIRKELVDILDAAARIIEIHLAVAVSIEAALDHNLIIVNRKHLVRIVKDEDDLRHAESTACGGAGKDDVLGAQTAQHANILLAENPANSVRNIAFSAAVRPHHGGDPLIELYDDPLGE